jgi:heptaprenyl diphosphate synthase
MGSSPNSFLNLFQAQWKQHIESFPERHNAARQLVLGSRFRPLLVGWGYLLAGAKFELLNRSELAWMAVYVELLHKATLLIDDLIDQDHTRNGEKSFHAEFGDHEAILFAIYLLGDSVERLSAADARSPVQERDHSMIRLLCEAIKNMSRGAIEEVVSPSNELVSLRNAKKIIELQTIALVKNGLMTGFAYGGGDPDELNVVENLGYDCGYLFQVLNDLEPFLGTDLNIIHKGRVNYDVLRSRKNIAVAFLAEKLTVAERHQLHALMDASDPLLASFLSRRFLDYGVLDAVVDNLSDVTRNIRNTIATFPVNAERRIGFSAFVDYVLADAARKIGDPYRERLSDILIR